MQQSATGKKGIQGAEGTWRDCEDGDLQGNPIAQGSVDSAVGIRLQVPAKGTGECHYWLAAGRSYDDVDKLNRVVIDKTPKQLLIRTENYWRLWVKTRSSIARGSLTRSWICSIAVCWWCARRSTTAAACSRPTTRTSSSSARIPILMFGLATARSSWRPLSDNRYTFLSRRYFEFCANVIEEEGFFLHKYNPDGSLASSWHPWVRDGITELPIQEDETALVLWALRRLLPAEPPGRVDQAALSLASSSRRRNSRVVPRRADGAPLPSHDLWEERRAIHTFTVSTVIGALRAAAAFAADFGEEDLATKYGTAAAQIQAALVKHMWDPK